MTHVVPDSGLPTWPEPNPAQPQGPGLSPGLGVQVLEVTPSGWARIVCSNGWSAWVDGSQLRSGRRGFLDDLTRMPGTATTPVALGGAALVLLGAFLPWWRAGDDHATAWDIPARSLLGDTLYTNGPKAGLLLLVVLLVGVPLLTRRPVSGWVNTVVGGVASNVAGCASLLAIKFEPHLGIGIGLVLCFVGGAAIAGDRMVALHRATQ